MSTINQLGMTLDECTYKWRDILHNEKETPITEVSRLETTAVLLENTERALEMHESVNNGFGQLNEDGAPSNHTGSASNWDPILISLVRRNAPILIAYDMCGVQPMSGPTGLIFAMKSRYNGGDVANPEAQFDEVGSGFSGQGRINLQNTLNTTAMALATEQAKDPDTPLVAGNAIFDAHADAVAKFAEAHKAGDSTAGLGQNPGTGVWNPVTGQITNTPEGTTAITRKENLFGTFMNTATGEGLGREGGADFAEMGFTIEKTTVTAGTRKLKAGYSIELAQDLRAIHGLDAETELANILSTEILGETNRQIVRTMYDQAKLGCLQANIGTKGIFDLSTDADGRWSKEKFLGLMVQIDRECNVIAKETRRGRGNFVLCSSDVATALRAAGMLDYTPKLSLDLKVDDTGNTFAGMINGRTKCYIDPYATSDYCMVGYKGSNSWDAGVYYCPYVPLTMMRAVEEKSFQPLIGFQTRAGIVANPFVLNTANEGTSVEDGVSQSLSATSGRNQYFRIFRVDNILR